jgi:hypothetical protein
MNYSLHYKRLIERAPKEKPASYITEGHHIVPKCIGGTDKDGIAYLTPEEHYIAHLLLVKMYPQEPKLVYAASMMTVTNNSLKRANNKRYGWLRKKYIEVAKIFNSNRKHTEETKLKISLANKGKKLSKEHREKIAEANRRRKGISCSPEVRAKIGAARKGKPGKKHTEETKRKMSLMKKGLKLKPGKKLTDEHKRNISKANKGRIHTEQALENMRKGRKAARERKLLLMNSSSVLAEIHDMHQAIPCMSQNSNQ